MKDQKQKTSSLTLSRGLKHLSCLSFGIPNCFCLCSSRSTNFLMTYFPRQFFSELCWDVTNSNNTSFRTSQPTPFQNSMGNKGFTTRKWGGWYTDYMYYSPKKLTHPVKNAWLEDDPFLLKSSLFRWHWFIFRGGYTVQYITYCWWFRNP